MFTTFKIQLCNESMQILNDFERFPLLAAYLGPFVEYLDPKHIEVSVNQYLCNADTDEHMLETEAFLEAMGNMVSIQCD